MALTPRGRDSLLLRVTPPSPSLPWRIASGDGPLALVSEAPHRANSLVQRIGNVVVVRGNGSGNAAVYYHLDRDQVEIDTDLDRLVAHTAASGLDHDSLLHFVWRGRPIAGRTLYAGIYRLGPADELVCAPSLRPAVRRVAWTLEAKSVPADAEPRGLITETLARIRSAIASGQTAKAAVLLSGGVDSSLLAALASQRSIDVTGFTVEFDPAYGLNETSHAQRVAEFLGIEHRIVRLTAHQALRHLDTVLAARRPRAAPAAITQAALMERIAQTGHERVLSGLGADECFGGYHKPLEHLAALAHHLPRYSNELGRLYALPLSRLLRLRNALFFGIAEFFSLQELRAIAVDPGRVRELAAPDLTFYREALAFKAEAQPLELMAAHEYAFRLNELLLPAFSTGAQAPEVEYPFLSSRVYPWASSLDPALCYWHEDGAWWAKRLLRAAAGKLLPQDIIMRKRQVFLAPLAQWLLEKSWRIRVCDEIGDSAFWNLGVVHKHVRKDVLRKLHRYRSIDLEPRWQEQLWLLLSLCAWVNRQPASATGRTQ